MRYSKTMTETTIAPSRQEHRRKEVTDQLAKVAYVLQAEMAEFQANDEKNGSGNFVTIEVFQGSLRSNPLQENQRLVVVASSLEQAQRLKDKFTREGIADNISVVVAAARADALPFKAEVGSVVDPHEASYVGGSHYPSVGERLKQLITEFKVWKNVEGVARPTYYTESEHTQMLSEFTRMLGERARLMKDHDTVCFSVAAREEGVEPTAGYYAEHHREGQLCVSLSELKTMLDAVGLELQEETDLYCGMAPKNQAVATESAAKAFAMTILGKEKEHWFNEVFIAKAHQLIGSTVEKLEHVGFLKQRVQDEATTDVKKLRPAGIGAYLGSGAYPDRFIAVARKKRQT